MTHLGSLTMILYKIWLNFLLILFMILFYGIGYSGAQCFNTVSGLIFAFFFLDNANS